MNTTTKRTAVFGPYTLDLRSAELRKFGTKVKMGEQTFQILRMLLESPGELVSRDELRAKLWAEDTFVDFDHGLNSAVQRLRDCLSDSAESPQWIETVPRRGYRFVGQVECSEAGSSSDGLPGSSIVSPGAQADENAEAAQAQESTKALGRPSVLFVVVALVFLLAAFPAVNQIRKARSAKRAQLIRSLAVLPLDNLSGNPAEEYFADGMTDEVITMLAKNPALRVTSRTSVMQYKGVHRPLPEIAAELGVDGILEGSVGRLGSRVHMTAQLIHAASDTHVWAESFDRDLSDVGSLQSELAEAIAKQVGAATSIASKPEKEVKPEAHDAYLRGRYQWFLYDYDGSGRYFQKAIELQPDYAAAWSGLADSYSATAAMGWATPAATMPQAEAAARKAIELDGSVAEAHNSMAAVDLFYRWDWEDAERESTRAIELNPNLGEARHMHSLVLTALNRMDEAVQEERKAAELDPLTRPWAVGWALIKAHQYDAAIAELRVRSGAQPNDGFVHSLLWEAYFYRGKEKEAEQELAGALRRIGQQKFADEADQAYRRGGFQSVLESRLNQHKLNAAKNFVSALLLAEDYGRLKRKEETIHYLERAYDERAPFMAHIQSNPDFDFVHSDPRYRAIVGKMGLPTAH